MTQIVGIRRDGHRYTTTVTGRPGMATVVRVHHPDCACHTQPAPTPAAESARISRRRKPTTNR
jgi:hypothetical protein